MALHNDIGKLGENLVAEHLRAVAPVEKGEKADLRLGGQIEIEVKTAIPSRPTKGNRRLTYQFCVRRDGRKGLRAPVLVCVCIDPARLATTRFVIPAWEIEDAGLKKVRIPYDVEQYKGRWATYREAWGVLAEAVNNTEMAA